MGQTLLLYDDGCGVCKCVVAAVLARDDNRRLMPVAITSEHGGNALASMPAQERNLSWHVVDANGRVRSGASVVLELADLSAGIALAARVVAAAPKVSNAAYGALARRRRLWGRLVRSRHRIAAERLIAQRAAPA
jgi:predicted DCC family thiol-disulfide oxidoreductase YuxK